MLQAVFLRQEIERFRGFRHVAEQFVARDAGQPVSAAFLKAVFEVSIGEFHRDEHLPIHHVASLDGKNKGMTNLNETTQGVEFLVGADR
jgi:hypothetical protein